MGKKKSFDNGEVKKLAKLIRKHFLRETITKEDSLKWIQEGLIEKGEEEYSYHKIGLALNYLMNNGYIALGVFPAFHYEMYFLKRKKRKKKS